jgi:uncharacterized membrane protein
MKSSLKTVKQIGFDALFLALFFVFAYVPNLGYITIFGLSFTTMHILVLLGAILFGWKRGALYGLFFGITSLLIAITHPGTLDYFSLNPFISILPRVVFGLISGLTFDGLRRVCSQKVFNALAFPISGALTLLHTILYFVCFYFFGLQDVMGFSRNVLGLGSLIDTFANSYGSFLIFISTFMAIGSAVEIGGAALIIPALYMAINTKFNLGKVASLEERQQFHYGAAPFATLIITCVAFVSVIITSLLI